MVNCTPQPWCSGVKVHVVALASRKGGAGKTTLASHLAVAAEAAGSGPVALMDTDPQGGLAGWWNARAAGTPEWIDPAGGLSAAVAGCRVAGYCTLLIDTPPSLSETIAEVLTLADLILVPVQPSPNDLRAVGGTVELAAASGKPMVFVINRATARARITTQAAIALSQYGAVAPIVIHARVDFATSMTDGRTAAELDPTSKSAGEVAELWAYLQTRLTQGDTYAASRPHAA
jgi:chromosome partitioning protein